MALHLYQLIIRCYSMVVCICQVDTFMCIECLPLQRQLAILQALQSAACLPMGLLTT